MDGPEFDAGMDTRAGTPQVRNGTREGPQSPARPPIGMIWPCPTSEQAPSHRQKRLQPLEVQSQASLRRWWEEMGKSRYPEARELFITADAGGSNGYRSRVWKHELQQLADEMGVCIHVSHFPPGTSKWNKIEHRVFCHMPRLARDWAATSGSTMPSVAIRAWGGGHPMRCMLTAIHGSRQREAGEPTGAEYTYRTVQLSGSTSASHCGHSRRLSI